MRWICFRGEARAGPPDDESGMSCAAATRSRGSLVGLQPRALLRA
jgi:hypothetical protein